MGKIVTKVTRKLQLFVTGRVPKNRDFSQMLQKLHIFTTLEKLNTYIHICMCACIFYIEVFIFVTCNYIYENSPNYLKLSNLRRLQ